MRQIVYNDFRVAASGEFQILGEREQRVTVSGSQSVVYYYAVVSETPVSVLYMYKVRFAPLSVFVVPRYS